MNKHRKTWSTSKKMEVINYEKKNGPVRASREYGVSITSIYNWKDHYEQEGEAGLKPKRNGKTESTELRRLRRENDELKKIVAEKELRLRIQSDMLKKNH